MRGLAEYAMHGRRQAIIVILLSGFLSGFLSVLYFISAATVGLVTLRKGGYEGMIVLLWALLPAILLWRMGDISPLFLLPGAMGLSLLLRRTESWQLVIVLATVAGLLTQFSLNWQPEYLGQFETLATEIVNAQQSQNAQGQYTVEQLLNLLKQFYGAYHAFALVLCVILARWLQAALYNPGGFRQEFHSLHFDTRTMLVVLGLV
ncbi:MAG: hypothetical protein WD601_14715, partial [Pseudohongiellaceae bacterium]